MRIVSGTARGRPLEGPKHEGLRPTSDRTRQVLFDLLGQRLDGGDVLDLYCGTGGLALEALSRGCARALCVDSDPRALALTLSNARAVGFGERVEARRANLPAALAQLPLTPRRLIFADPPYEGAEEPLRSLLRWVSASGILAPEGIAVLETSRHSTFDDARVETLTRRERRAVGDTVLHLFSQGDGNGL